MKKRYFTLALEITVLSMIAIFLFAALYGEHPESSRVRDYIVENGSRETGALNLVTAIYLGYRAFDTLGETMVLLLAVSGVVYFVDLSGKKDGGVHEKNDHS